MDPMDGDSGALGGVFDQITSTVNSIETFGRTVQSATTWSMTTAMIWAVIIFMFVTLLLRVIIPWNTAAAKRWEATGVILTPTAPFKPSKDARIADLEAKNAELEDKIAAALAQLAALTAAAAASTTEAASA